MPNPQWIHEEDSDGHGCGWCGSWAQVNEDELCEDCWDRDQAYGQDSIAEDTFERMVQASR